MQNISGFDPRDCLSSSGPVGRVENSVHTQYQEAATDQIWIYDPGREGHFGGMQMGALCASRESCFGLGMVARGALGLGAARGGCGGVFRIYNFRHQGVPHHTATTTTAEEEKSFFLLRWWWWWWWWKCSLLVNAPHAAAPRCSATRSTSTIDVGCGSAQSSRPSCSFFIAGMSVDISTRLAHGCRWQPMRRQSRRHA